MQEVFVRKGEGYVFTACDIFVVCCNAMRLISSTQLVYTTHNLPYSNFGLSQSRRLHALIFSCRKYRCFTIDNHHYHFVKKETPSDIFPKVSESIRRYVVIRASNFLICGSYQLIR